MTTNISIPAKKRNFTIPTTIPKRSDVTITIDSVIGEQMLWDDGTDIQWDDGTQILWSTEASVNPIVIPVKKRNFTVIAKARA